MLQSTAIRQHPVYGKLVNGKLDEQGVIADERDGPARDVTLDSDGDFTFMIEDHGGTMYTLKIRASRLRGVDARMLSAPRHHHKLPRNARPYRAVQALEIILRHIVENKEFTIIETPYADRSTSRPQNIINVETVLWMAYYSQKLQLLHIIKPNAFENWSDSIFGVGSRTYSPYDLEVHEVAMMGAVAMYMGSDKILRAVQHKLREIAQGESGQSWSVGPRRHPVIDYVPVSPEDKKSLQGYFIIPKF